MAVFDNSEIKMPKNYPRRFVAGAVCPRCKKIDTTVIFCIDDLHQIACVHCDFTQTQHELVQPAATSGETEIRWNKPKPKDKT